MKVLEFSVRYWRYCGVYLSATSTTWDNYQGLLSIFVLAGALILFFWLSLLICLEIVGRGTVNMSQLFFPLLGVIGSVAAFGPYISAVFVRRKSADMIELLQRIVDKRKLSTTTKRVVLISNVLSHFRIESSQSNHVWKCWTENILIRQVVAHFVCGNIQSPKAHNSNFVPYSWFYSRRCFRSRQLLRSAKDKVFALWLNAFKFVVSNIESSFNVPALRLTEPPSVAMRSTVLWKCVWPIVLAPHIFVASFYSSARACI